MVQKRQGVRYTLPKKQMLSSPRPLEDGQDNQQNQFK